jgi:hypothetical protein
MLAKRHTYGLILHLNEEYNCSSPRVAKSYCPSRLTLRSSVLTKSISDTDAGIFVESQYIPAQPKDLLLVFTGEGVNERALELYARACENLPMVRNAFPRPRTIEKIGGQFRGAVKLHLSERRGQQDQARHLHGGGMISRNGNRSAPPRPIRRPHTGALAPSCCTPT